MSTKTATRLDNLQLLGEILREQLRLELPNTIPFQVQCVLQEGILIVLAQHPPGVVPDPQQSFKVLEAAIRAEQPETPYQVKLYLRVGGQKRPYAFNTFTVEPLAQPTFSPLEEESRHEGISLTEEGKQEGAAYTEEGRHGSAAPTSQQKVNPWDRPIPEVDMEPDNVPEGRPLQEHLSSDSTADFGQKQKSNPFELGRISLPIVLAGAGIAGMFFACSLYVLTRPCVITECREIPAARQLSYKSAQTLQQPRTGKEILEAQRQLDSAIAMLESIPYWSSHYNEAQNIVKVYQVQAKKLNDVIEVLKKAAKASIKSQNPPHSTSEWVEIQKLWQDAALELQQVPRDSNVYNLAQQKQRTYKVNLAVAKKRSLTEQQAKQYLEAANVAAKMAQARQGVAQSLENWYLVLGTWQVAVNRLSEIPQGTTAYKEAQQLLPAYQTQLAAVRDRTIQEQFAANVYKQSTRIADRAKNFQAINQWSQAVVTWNNALTYLKQIPKGTDYYSKTPLLVVAYTNALKQAQVQLQLATMMQQARSDLNQTCAGKPAICTFTIASNVIKVRLTSDYMQRVRNAALVAKARNDYTTQAGVVKHVQTLGEALEAISDNARIRLEVYTPDGTLKQAHNP